MGITAAITATLAVAEGVNSLVGNHKAATGAKNAANFQAGILEQQATDTINIGDETANRAAQSGRALTGAQRTSAAASGVDAGSGSAADVQANDARLAAMDVTTIKNNAAREALGLKQQAQLVRIGGANTAQSYQSRATGSLLSSAADLYSIYDKYGQTSTSATPRKASASPTHSGTLPP